MPLLRWNHRSAIFLFVLGLSIPHHCNAELVGGVVPLGRDRSVWAVVYREGSNIKLRECNRGQKLTHSCIGTELASLTTNQYFWYLSNSTGLAKLQTFVGTNVEIPPIKVQQLDQRAYTEALLIAIDRNRQKSLQEMSQNEDLLGKIQVLVTQARNQGKQVPERVEKLLQVAPGLIVQAKQAINQMDELKERIKLIQALSIAIASPWVFDPRAKLPDTFNSELTQVSSMVAFIQLAFRPFIDNKVLEPFQ